MSDRFVVLSGCSGGGKSTLLDELGRRGCTVVEEPGRRIVREERARSGTALPWIDLAAFARRAVELALADRADAAARTGWVFFDRGLLDAAAALQHATGEAVLAPLGRMHRYHATVFFTPPWPEIFQSDPERKHGFETAVAEHDRLECAYRDLGYRIVALPRTSVAARADWMLAELRAARA